MAHHDLKTDGPVFEAVLKGDKTHEIRFNDRNFQVGDTMTLHETQYTGAEMNPQIEFGPSGAAVPAKPLVYTGRAVGPLLITHVLSDYGLQPGRANLSFRKAGAVITSVTWQRDPFKINYKGIRWDGSEFEDWGGDPFDAIAVMAADLNRRGGS